MAERIYLHVGTPKSGTTYLQAVVWQNAAALRRDGLLLPGSFKAHYAAAKGVTARSGQLRETRQDLATAWQSLAAAANAWPEAALVSHELLSPATQEQAQRAVRLLHDTEIHIVLTARALARQLPASWQEQVKGGLAAAYDVFLRRVREEDRKGEWFWLVQDVPAIAARWSPRLPPEHVHVVTVPPGGVDPDLLWRRYSSVLGLDPSRYDATVEMKNVSLGPVEAELLRRVHAARDNRFTDKQRHRWTRKLLAIEVLGQRRGTGIALPEGARGWLDGRTRSMIQDIDAAGYDVVGDLDDLLAAPDVEQARLVSSVTSAELVEAARWTIGRLQEELMRRRPEATPPPVGPEDGVDGILELLEHIRAADTTSEPRPCPEPAEPLPEHRLRALVPRRHR